MHIEVLRTLQLTHFIKKNVLLILRKLSLNSSTVKRKKKERKLIKHFFEKIQRNLGTIWDFQD